MRRRRPPCTGLDRVREPRADVAIDLQAVHDHLEHRAILQGRGIDIVEGHGLAVHVEPAEALLAERGDRFSNRIDKTGEVRLRRGTLVAVGLGGAFLLVGLRREGERRAGHDRHIETDQQTCPGWQTAQRLRHDFSGLADHFTAAVRQNVRPTRA